METLRFLMVSTFYPPYHLGGDAVHVQYLAEALAAQGHEVHVEYSPAAFRAKRRGTRASGADASRAVHIHPMTGPRQLTSPVGAYVLGRSRSVQRAHARVVREANPDVIHLHNISLLGLSVAEGSERQPLLYTAHDYWFRCPRSDLLKRNRAPCESPACLSCLILSRRVPPLWRGTDVARRMNKVRCVIAPSAFMRGLASASFSAPVVHIPNFVPDKNPSGEVGRDSPYFLYVGVLERHKGLFALADAAMDYSGTKRFLIVGSGSEAAALRARAEHAGGRLEVRPWVDREPLPALYKDAAALIMPSSWFENAPLAAIEALSWGVPLLVTARGGAPELLRGGSAGYSFEPNARELGRVLGVFDAHPNPVGMRRAARTAYATYHSPEVYLSRYLALVRTILSGDPQNITDRANDTQPPISQTLLQRG